MKYYFLFTIIFIISCAKPVTKQTSDNIKMTSSELVSQKGNPSNITENVIIEDAQMYEYEKTKYQVRNDLVEAKFRDPKGDEKQIQYWKHKFSKYKIVENKNEGHTKYFLMIMEKEGITIFFNENGSVHRISELLGSKYE